MTTAAPTSPAIANPSPTVIDRGYRRVAIGRGRYRLHLRLRSAALAAALVTTIVTTAIVSLGLGTYPLSPGAVVETLA